MAAADAQRAVPDEDLDDILNATTGDFEVASEGDDDSSAAADHDLDDMLLQSTGSFLGGEDDDDNGHGGEDAEGGDAVLKMHLQKLVRPPSSSAIEETQARIRELTRKKQQLYSRLAH